MVKDPIVEEVRAVRDEMFRQAGGILERLTALRRSKRKVRTARKLATYKSKKPVVFTRAV